MGDNRPSGLLSTKQRGYLRGDYDPSNEATMRQRIRERVRHSLADFSLLYHHQEEHDRTAVFEPSDWELFFDRLDEGEHSMYDPDSVPEKTEKDSVIPGLQDAVSYAYLGLRDRGLNDDNFAELLRNAIKQAVERREGNDVIAEVKISIETELREERLHELRERYLAGESLSKDELSALMDSDPTVVVDQLTDDSDKEQ